jgi:superfamily II DNA helicase RecQ
MNPNLETKNSKSVQEIKQKDQPQEKKSGNWKPFASTRSVPDITLTTEESRLYLQICVWRKGVAMAEGRPSYTMVPNTTLKEVIKLKPKNLAELSQIRGFGGKRLEKYGRQVLGFLL